MGVFSLYLSRVSGLDEFVIGTPILNRGTFKEKQTTGMFISTIPFKVSINHEDLFGDFISKISTDFLKIFRHQKYPYQYILEDLRAKEEGEPENFNEEAPVTEADSTDVPSIEELDDVVENDPQVEEEETPEEKPEEEDVSEA
mgnify:CR=1 FL=1